MSISRYIINPQKIFVTVRCAGNTKVRFCDHDGNIDAMMKISTQSVKLNIGSVGGALGLLELDEKIIDPTIKAVDTK